ncbi:TRAP transporter small permease [Ancylomarina sp. 16SWW S1-10-2]|uniref:TRAP transporter small permease n=2 Tax=Ancylomarina sp. 16SWW S1-10-2 TaxID=2499681 RepID=UPI0012AE11C0|nr:TRAP transporter small permease [Ancylomarina sp. 16SWW S1-10-2]MRT93981.1 TRAP transporter small permease [Ancylomarina sp. 16SWW S1-10-2]
MTFKNQLDRILEKILISLMCILVLDVLWQVLSRYALAAPSSFTDELAGFLLIWVGLLGAAYVAGQKEHLAIDLLLQKSSPANQKRLVRFINVCIALFALSVMIIGGSWLVITRFQFQVNSAALQIPLGYIYLVLPLSGLITLYYSIVFIVEPAEELN